MDATKVPRGRMEAWRFCAEAQRDYGKWLINTLWLMHSGAIVGLLFRATTTRPSYFGALWWFVVGIVLAFLAGFAAWWNFTFLADKYRKWSNPGMIENDKDWPKDDPLGNLKSTITMVLAIVFGSLSLVCLIGGAAAIYCNWKP